MATPHQYPSLRAGIASALTTLGIGRRLIWTSPPPTTSNSSPSIAPADSPGSSSVPSAQAPSTSPSSPTPEGFLYAKPRTFYFLRAPTDTTDIIESMAYNFQI